ncbi:SagB/ThcOx family dehydrogenase [Victivallis sp. Marseille-Q1083]|uniref:SagB/ThcOx family dehydrogenase n=1 Tax=Victivallis sp. Marseille-Q1083 TaxID=2717288 RepID=UPI00158B480D|nr:SagB/ThcOx family dehydrogenase [Victivallis sp. Marseille-Q1083]
MNRFSVRLLAGAALAGFGVLAQAADIELPEPEKSGGMPLMEALQLRQSTRAYSAEPLSEQLLSNLLWAADGVSRPDGKRTAPSAMNQQTIDLYVLLAGGTYRYDAARNRLIEVTDGDLRSKAVMQDFAQKAPLVLVYVTDTTKRQGEQGLFYGAVDCGFIGQNVYLFCAANRLGTVFLGSVNVKAMETALKLPENHKVIFAQAVGHPAEEQQ